MRFTYILLLTCSFFTISLKAQIPNVARCYTDELLEQAQEIYPELVRISAARELRYELNASNGNLSRASGDGCEVYIIPTVFHIVYDDEISNISDEQILSQMEVLNQDYRKVSGTLAEGNGVDMKIQFALATKDPEGNPTNGITRTESNLSAHNSSNDTELKELIKWDTERYLNIWVVNEISSGSGTTLGYTYIPGTVPRSRDGVVITSKYVGTVGTVSSPYNKGRTLTHEIGHFFGLHHTFRSEGTCSDTSAFNCLVTGDRVCDTPAEEEAKYFCPDEINSCIEFPCDRPDPIRNYLNYVDDVCMDEFTEGQKQRAEFFLQDFRNKLISEENLIFTGILNTPIRKTVPEVRFTSRAISTCAGSTVEFFDESIGCIDGWQWEFPGGTPSTSTSSAPLVSYPTPGWYDVKLKVNNDSASAEITKSRYIFVPESSDDRAFAHNFEMGTVIPTGWQIYDEDGEGSWLLTTLGSSDGIGAALMRNFQLNSNCTYDDLISTTIDLSKTDNAQLNFDYAYKLRTEEPIPGDRLLVDLSTNCGLTYSTILFDKSGAGLATASGSSSDEAFVPRGQQDWETVTIPLGSFAGRSNIRIRFRNQGKGGQQLYLDRIEVSATLGVEEDIRNSLSVYPNPLGDESAISLRLRESQELNFTILDIRGKKVSQTLTRRLISGQNQLKIQEINNNKLSAGIYLLEIEGEDVHIYEKLVKY